MDLSESGRTARLQVIPERDALRADQDNLLCLAVRLQAPRVPGTGLGPWARRVRLFARPSAGVAVTIGDGFPRAPAPIGETGWLLPDLAFGAESHATLHLEIDRGLAIAGHAAPLLWVRIAADGPGDVPIALAAPAVALPARHGGAAH